jgi:hypothetical protein
MFRKYVLIADTKASSSSVMMKVLVEETYSQHEM